MSYVVVVSEPGVERECRREVRDAGFITYQPQWRERIIRYGKKLYAERLLLGRYFFAKHDPGLDWKEIPHLRRVHGLLMSTDAHHPSLVPDKSIEDIRKLEDRSGFVVPEGGGLRFLKDQLVWATSGVMTGLSGQYVGQRNGNDIALIELFGQPSRVEFRPGVLAAA